MKGGFGWELGPFVVLDAIGLNYFVNRCNSENIKLPDWLLNMVKNNLTKEKFLDELDSFEKITGGKSEGFRAPTFSINQNTSWAINALLEKNYKLKCAINSSASA